MAILVILAWLHQWNIGFNLVELTKLTNPTMYMSHIPQCTTVEQKCTHFCSKMVHCGIWDRCIVGFVNLVHWMYLIPACIGISYQHHISIKSGWLCEKSCSACKQNSTSYSRWIQKYTERIILCAMYFVYRVTYNLYKWLLLTENCL